MGSGSLKFDQVVIKVFLGFAVLIEVFKSKLRAGSLVLEQF